MASCLAAACLVAAVTAQADSLFDHHRRVTTTAGHEVRIGSHARWDRRCMPQPVPTILVTEPPKGGAVTTRPGTKIAHGSVGGAICDGREVAAIVVYYTPAPGFLGSDEVKYTAGYSTETTTQTVTIDVAR